MSGYANISAVPDQNILYQAASGQTLLANQRNQLLNQETAALMPYKVQEAQQQVGSAEMAVMGQAAQGLLNMPDEASRAAAYPGLVQSLQQQGFARNAPTEYPGEARLKSFVATSLPVTQQYNLGLAVDPSFGPTLRSIVGGGGGAGGAGAGGGGAATASLPIPPRGVGGPGASAEMPPELLPYFREASQTYNIPMDLLIAQARQESGFRMIPGKSGEIGIMQIMPGTARGMGIDPTTLNDPRANILAGARYLRERAGVNADMNNPAVQATALHAYNGGGDPNYVANVNRYRPGFSPTDPARQVTTYQAPAPGTQVASAPGTPAPAAPGGGVAARIPGAVQVAGPGAGPPAGSTAPAAALAAPTTSIEPETGLPMLSAPPNQMLPGQPGTPPPAAAAPPPPAAAPTAPATPAAPQPQQQAQQQPNLPHYWEVPTGERSEQFQRARDLENRAAAATALAARYPPNSPQARQAAAAAASLTQQATELKGVDTIVQTQEGPVHVLTGQRDKPVEPLANYVFSPDAGGPGVPGFIDTTNTHEPKISPARRLVQRPDGTVIDDTGRVVSPADLPGAQAAAAAKASGTAMGGDVVKQTNAIYDQGREADRAIANIDYGVGQLREAAKGGIPSGYFSEGLATAAAAAKSLGIDTSSLGVDPKAVGSVQAAQKTLAVVAAAILQQALGSAQITDAKVSQYIHTQPGLENDPQALERILGWARTQFVYESEMSRAGAGAAADNNGILPQNWRAQYFRTHGYAPIYNPSTGETEQPEGRSPSRQMPAAATPPAPSRIIKYGADGKRIN